MAQYDGSIRINTKIDSKEASVQLMSLENSIVKTADRVASLRSKMDALKDAKIPTQEYKEITSQIEKAEQKFNKLLEKQEQMQREGKDNGVAWQRLNDQMDEIGNEIRYAKGELQDLVDSGKAFTLGSDTEEFTKLGQQLQYAEKDLSVLNLRHAELISKQNKTSNGYKNLGDTAKRSFEKVNKSVKKSNGFLKTMSTRFKGLALSLLIFNQISKAFRTLTSGIKEGFENFYKGNEKFKNSIDSLRANMLTLKNSFGAAFAPLVQMVIPYIQKAVEWMNVLIGKIGQFIAAVSGQKTYIKAIKQTTTAIKEQNKEQNKQLSSLDKLNNLTSDKGNDADDGGTGDMFEEVPVDNSVLDFLQKIKDFLKPIIDYAKKLKNVFMEGFWDGLGDWEYRWDSIKNSLASIKDSLIDIWTDPAVLASADKWVQSVAYMLGSFAGSVASIGLTIAANLLGGIAKYLEQNKGRIKEYLVSMFDIWAEVNYMFADLFQSIAYVFESFASEQGQQLTANIIGIFSDAFMGITELASKIFRDIAPIIIKPFVDNKEAFRTALEGFLGVLAEVTGTIKQGIDDTFDKLNEVYDTHFKPFFDSVAQGLSDLVGEFMEFWNEKVQPILDQMAADFDTLWKSHIQPWLNNAAEFLGKVADLLNTLWENILQPFISWIISNILPVILPVIQAIWDTLKNLAGYIADMINGVITIFGGLIDFITGVLSGDWEKAFQGLSDIVKGFVDTIVALVSGLGQLIYDLLNTIWEGIKSIFESFAESSRTRIQTFLDWINQNIFAKQEELSQMFSDFIENISVKWKNGWNTLKENLKLIIDEIKNIIKSAADWVVEKVEYIIDKISSINSSAKNMGSSFFSGKSPLLSGRNYSTMSYAETPEFFALNNAEIPRLATGAVIPANREFLAVLGDQKHGTNIEAPLSTIEEAVINAIAKINNSNNANNGGNVIVEIPVIISGIGEIGRAVQKFDNEFFKQHGKHAFT